MKAPPELVTQFERALEIALIRLRKRPELRADPVEQLVAEPRIEARIVGAALLWTGEQYGRSFDHSNEETQERILYYEDSVETPSRLALELLRYEEVETYIEQNQSDENVRRLLGSRAANEKLSAGLLRRMVLSNPQNVCMEIGGRRLTFLIRGANADRGVSMILDEKGYIEGIIPKVLSSAGEGPRYILFRGWLPPPKNSRAFVLDLKKGLYCEPEDMLQPGHEPGSRVVELSDSGVVFERASGGRFCTPFSTFKLMRPLPFY